MDNNSVNQNPAPAQTPVASASPPSVAPAKTSPARSFSKSEAIKFGFNLFKAHIVDFIKIGVVYLLIQIVIGIISSFLQDSPLGLVWSLISLALYFVISLGLTKIFLDLYDGKPLNLSNFYSLYPLAPRYAGASILYGLIVLGGYILLIIPGIIWSIKFSFYSYLIVDKNVGLMDSLKKSSVLTQGVKMNLFLFGFMIILLNILGLLALGVGLLVTIPTTIMASVYVYRKLLASAPTV